LGRSRASATDESSPAHVGVRGFALRQQSQLRLRLRARSSRKFDAPFQCAPGELRLEPCATPKAGPRCAGARDHHKINGRG